MKSITATPQAIRKIFEEQYIIPEFQRPYEWEETDCEQLFDDIVDFYEQNTDNEQYFLGTMVLSPSVGNDGKIFNVIDGQQRITSLSLLIRALFEKANTVTALEKCLKVEDNLQVGKFKNELRVKSNVITNDKNNLEAVLLNAGNLDHKSQIAKNYSKFLDKIDTWRANIHPTANEFEKFIIAFLDNVVLLPIHCGSTDDALTIFETINDRGRSLTDADMFKATLYKHTPPNEQKNFIKSWNKLKKHNELFRILMHIKRAKASNVYKEIALRSYFLKDDAKLRGAFVKKETTIENDILTKPTLVMESLQLLYEATRWESNNHTISSLMSIFKYYSNVYWSYPLYIFLHKYGKLNDNQTFEIAEENEQEFQILLETTIKYFFIKAITDNSVNSVKDTVFQVCADIEHSQDYLTHYKNNISENDYKTLTTSITENLFEGKRNHKAILLLVAYLNENQDKKEFSEFMKKGKIEIEHILPQNWNDYDDWTEVTHTEQLNLLGNLVPLSKSSNIAAKNYFFKKKQDVYAENGHLQDIIDLLRLDNWTQETLNERNKEVIDRLLKYLKFE